MKSSLRWNCFSSKWNSAPNGTRTVWNSLQCGRVWLRERACFYGLAFDGGGGVTKLMLVTRMRVTRACRFRSIFLFFCFVSLLSRRRRPDSKLHCELKSSWTSPLCPLECLPPPASPYDPVTLAVLASTPEQVPKRLFFSVDTRPAFKSRVFRFISFLFFFFCCCLFLPLSLVYFLHLARSVFHVPNLSPSFFFFFFHYVRREDGRQTISEKLWGRLFGGRVSFAPHCARTFAALLTSNCRPLLVHYQIVKLKFPFFF